MSTPDARLSRRSLISLAAGGAAALTLGARPQPAAASEIVLPVPYLCQGGTGGNEGVNCGPAAVAMAINYSQVAAPTVADVRATLGIDGPTDLDHWMSLLNAYGAPWYSTWSQWEMDVALSQGHAVLVAVWMGDVSTGADFETAYTEHAGWSGRYDSFSEGHALLITGKADDGIHYLVHDPNVFPNEGTSFYADGTPKGVYRRYSGAELWTSIGQYGGEALAVIPPAPMPDPNAVKRVGDEQAAAVEGPGGGHKPRRGVTSLITRPSER